MKRDFILTLALYMYCIPYFYTDIFSRYLIVGLLAVFYFILNATGTVGKLNTNPTKAKTFQTQFSIFVACLQCPEFQLKKLKVITQLELAYEPYLELRQFVNGFCAR